MGQELLYAYVDETGDRGVSAKSSPFFAMAGLVMTAEDDPEMRAAVEHCRRKLDLPGGKALHWKDHVKTYARRQLVARTLARVPGACVNYVIIEKAAIHSTAGMYRDHTIFYNYVAGLMIERFLFTADTWPGGPREIIVRFGHVKGFGTHADTRAYLSDKRKNPNGTPWHLLRKVEFPSVSEYDGLQAADQYGGLLKVAIVPDEYDGYEEHHLLSIRHQIRQRNGGAWGAGFKVMALPGTMDRLPWWIDAELGPNQGRPRA
jgi:hypothetical protein